MLTLQIGVLCFGILINFIDKRRSKVVVGDGDDEIVTCWNYWGPEDRTAAFFVSCSCFGYMVYCSWVGFASLLLWEVELVKKETEFWCRVWGNLGDDEMK